MGEPPRRTSGAGARVAEDGRKTETAPRLVGRTSQAAVDRGVRLVLPRVDDCRPLGAEVVDQQGGHQGVGGVRLEDLDPEAVRSGEGRGECAVLATERVRVDGGDVEGYQLPVATGGGGPPARSQRRTSVKQVTRASPRPRPGRAYRRRRTGSCPAPGDRRDRPASRTLWAHLGEPRPAVEERRPSRLSLSHDLEPELNSSVPVAASRWPGFFFFFFFFFFSTVNTQLCNYSVRYSTVSGQSKDAPS